MARCGNCGKANRDGALFCQDCGQALETRAALASDVNSGSARLPPAATSVAPAAAPVAAPAPVAAAAPQLPAPAGAVDDGRVARIFCPRCKEQTPAGFSFCQQCGARMAGAAEPRAPRLSGVIPILNLSAADGAAASVAAPPLPASPEPPRANRPPQSPSAAPSAAALRGRLVQIRRDGSDGDAILLGGDTFDIGRSEGNRCFTDDVYMAARHARLVYLSGCVRIRSLDLINGVFFQIREPYDLQSGDVFYLGRELIRLEILPHDERDPAPLTEHGVRLFGTTPRESWGRLRQLTPAGTSRDIWHLSRAEVRIGREEGDIVFPDDEFMSRRHAVLTRHGNRVRIEDQHSSNGTYVRLRGDRELQQGDVLRIGDQVLRFEP